MKQTWKRGKKLWWLLLALIVVMGAGLVVYAAWQLSSGLPGNADFYLNRSKYEGVVTKAKALPLAPGAQTQTSVDGFKVDVARSPKGSYTITITTVDWHHAGTYGYVFSDVPLAPHPNVNYPDYSSVDNPGDMPFSDKRIIGQEGHWWSVYNNLL
jgi:hypothetical protein